MRATRRACRRCISGSGTHASPSARAQSCGPLDHAASPIARGRQPRYYGKSHILRDVSFDVRDNEIVGAAGTHGRREVHAPEDPCRHHAAGLRLHRAGRRGARWTSCGADRARRRGLRAAGARALRRHVGRAQPRVGAPEAPHRPRRALEEARIFEFFQGSRRDCAHPPTTSPVASSRWLAVARALKTANTRLLFARRALRGAGAGRG